MSLKKIFLFTALVFPALLLFGCGAFFSVEPISRTAFYFDTVIQITIYDADRDKAETILDGCMETAAYYDELLKPGISPEKKDPETAALLDTAMYWRDVTDNTFNPYLGALTALWNFNGDPPGPVPSPDKISEALKQTSPSSPDALIDLGGIAKGYIADRLKDELISSGIKSAVVNLGGNVLLVGSKPDGTPFRVGIQDPDSETGAGLTGTIEVKDISIVTSGVYERYFDEGGRRYHHILDPKTGYPADSGLKAVTIISKDSTSGDALSTACLVLGLEKGQTLVKSLTDTEALFILDSGEIVKTAGFPALKYTIVP